MGVGLIGGVTAGAQSVFVPISPPATPQSSATFFSTNGVTSASIQAAAEPDPESQNPLRWGPFAAHPRIDYQYINASGIRQGSKVVPQGTNFVLAPKSVSTIQHVVSPGVNVQLGRQWNLDAGVSMNYYTDKALQDSFGYNVGLNGSIPRESWHYGVSVGFGSSETSQIETGEQTKQDSYSGGLTAVWGAQRRIRVELGVNGGVSMSERLNRSYNVSTMNWLNYVATTKTTVGIGVGGGYSIVDAGEDSFSATGTDSVNEQIQGRVTWNPQSKLSISLTGGAQIQQFLAEGDRGGTVVNPTFSVSSGYSPVDGTSLSLSASRSVGSSIAADQFTESTSVSFGFSQRLFGRLTLSISPSYNITDYRSSTDPTGDAARSDEVWAVNVSLSTVLFRKISASTFYNYTDNQSDEEFYAFDSRQFGFQLGYRF